jgi:hypothetical protein
MRRANAVRSRRPGLHWLGLILGAGAVVIVLVATLHGVLGNTDSFRVPSKATLAGLSLRRRIVAIAKSQVGYSTDPSNSYCNKYSAYWKAGNPTCPAGNYQEEWCADFAAWAWQKAGVHFTYGYRPGEINGATVSFYEWASPTTSGTRRRADTWLHLGTWRSTASRSGQIRWPCTWRSSQTTRQASGVRTW